MQTGEFVTVIDIMRRHKEDVFHNKYATVCMRKWEDTKTFYKQDPSLRGIGLNFLSSFIYESDTESYVSSHHDEIMHAGTDVGSTEVGTLMISLQAPVIEPPPDQIEH